MGKTIGEIAEDLTNLFYKRMKTSRRMKELRKEYDINADDKELYISLFYVFYLSFDRAIHSMTETEFFSEPVIQILSEGLAESGIENYRSNYNDSAEIDQLLTEFGKNYDRLVDIYNNNIDSKPSVHWHVGKEICKSLNKDIDPSIAYYFGELLHHYTISIKKYLGTLVE